MVPRLDPPPAGSSPGTTLESIPYPYTDSSLVRDEIEPMPRSLEGTETATRETYAGQVPLTREAKLSALRSVYKLSRKIDAKNRAEDEVDSESEDEAEDMDNQTTVYSSVFANIFHRVVGDEGQKLKNPKTRNFAAIETLYPPHIWIATA